MYDELEFSQIHSFAEVPIPKEFEAWMHRGDGEGGNKSVYNQISLISRFVFLVTHFLS